MEEPDRNAAEAGPFWTRTKAWIAGLTGVLIGVPALVNAGWDVLVAVRNLPRTAEEREQQDLYKRYFNEQPLGTYEIPVKTASAVLTYRLRIYSEHIFSQFGDRALWFPIAAPTLKSTAWFPSAHAQESTGPSPTGAYVIQNRYEKGVLVIEQLYADGTVSRLKLDPNTGRILGSETEHTGKPYGGVTPTVPNQVIQLPAIELEDLKRRDR
jgi:hypothetical protein